MEGGESPQKVPGDCYVITRVICHSGFRVDLEITREGPSCWVLIVLSHIAIPLWPGILLTPANKC